MTKTKHTPGPWEISPKNEAIITGENGDVNIATMWEAFHLDERTGERVEEAYANARLIAAAPDLLEALENLVFLHTCEQEGIESGQPTPEEWYTAVNAAEKAIQKAKGDGHE